MLPTITEVLQHPNVRRAGPRLVAGEQHLNNTVRWVHASEVLDIAQFLEGGELLLTTGIVLPDDQAILSRYISELAEVRLSALMIELGRNFDELPLALIRTADDEGLPLIALTREVPFVSITEPINSLIVDERLARLQFSNEVHRTFQSLSIEGASMTDVLREAAALLEAPVIFEGLGHQVIAFDTGGERDPYLLADWESRSRRASNGERTAVLPPEGWLVTRVGARGESWGRLIVLLGGEATDEQVMVAEWAATTLVVNRLVERDHARLLQIAHRNLLSELLNGDNSDRYILSNRLQAAGIPIRGNRYVGLCVYRGSGGRGGGGAGASGDEDADQVFADQVGAAARSLKLANLVGVLSPNWIAMMIVITKDGPVDATIRQLANRISGDARKVGQQPVIGVGPCVAEVDDIRHSLIEAAQVTEVATTMSTNKAYFALSDVHLRGLLHSLQGDPRVQDYVERELGRLIDHDRKTGSDLVEALSTYLDCGQNISAAAATFRISRPAFYHRLRQIEDVIQMNLGDPSDALSLYVAVTAMRIFRSQKKLVAPIVSRSLGPRTP